MPMEPPEQAAIPRRSGLARIGWAAVYSGRGLVAACRHEAAFRQELIASVVLIPVAIWLPSTLTQKALLIGSVLLVLAVELLNAAVEAAVDRHSTELHPLAARAKDLGSAAVFVTLVNCVAMWALVLMEVR